MELNFREYGQGDPVVIVHGLFGSASNWQSIARRLQDQYRLLAVDLRNHGDSPWDPDMSYPAMADDLSKFIDRHCQGRACVVGHSMGGKAAMVLALARPEAVSGLVVADIAPVEYPHRFGHYVDVLEELPLGSLSNRREADLELAEAIPSPGVRAFLLHNLRRGDSGWEWRVNLEALRENGDAIAGFPESPGQLYSGDSLFLRGAKSDYVTEADLGRIRELFPRAELESVTGAGHWIHAEQPDQVASRLADFLANLAET